MLSFQFGRKLNIGKIALFVNYILNNNLQKFIYVLIGWLLVGSTIDLFNYYKFYICQIKSINEEF